MSYGGYEYTDRGFGGFDPMGGFGGFGGGGGGGGMDMGMGGGFMPDDKKSGEKKSRDRQSLLPVTIKQLLNSRSHDDVFRVDGVELHTLKLIGTLVGPPQVHSTNITFQLNDGSGTLECKQWIEKDSSSFSKIQNLREGVLVRVVGNLREYDSKFNLMVFDVSPVIDWNELSYHLLEVIYTHLQNTQGPIPNAAGSAAAAGPAHSGHLGFGNPPPPAFGGGGSMGGGMSLSNAMKKEAETLTESIYRAYVSGGNNEAGMSFAEVAYVLKSQGLHISLDKLNQGVQQLCEDGRLYTTIDDQHYRPTSVDY